MNNQARCGTKHYDWHGWTQYSDAWERVDRKGRSFWLFVPTFNVSAKQQIVALAMKIAAKKVDDRFSSLRFCSYNNRKFETAVNTIIYCNRLYYQQFFPNSKTDVRLIVFLVKNYCRNDLQDFSLEGQKDWAATSQ